MINDYSLSKVFYEDLYKAFIFYVEHLRKVFKQAFVNIKSHEFNLVLKKACWKRSLWGGNGLSHRKQNRSRVTSGEGGFYKRGFWERTTILEKDDFGECFNQKWVEGIDWVSTKESDFGLQSKKSKVDQHRRDNFLFKVPIFRT